MYRVVRIQAGQRTSSCPSCPDLPNYPDSAFCQRVHECKTKYSFKPMIFISC